MADRRSRRRTMLLALFAIAVVATAWWWLGPQQRPNAHTGDPAGAGGTDAASTAHRSRFSWFRNRAEQDTPVPESTGADDEWHPTHGIIGATVLDAETRKPIEGADISARQGWTHEVGRAKTKADGTFEIDVPLDEQRPLRIRARKEGYAEGWGVGYPTMPRQEILLSRGVAISGRVVSDAEPDGVAGATVGCRSASANFFNVISASVTTAEDGGFELPHCPLDGWRNALYLEVRHPRYALLVHDLGALLPDETVENLTLHVVAGARVAGIVLDADRQPVRGGLPHHGAWVIADDGTDGRTRSGLTPGQALVTTDPQGRFDLGRLAPGTWKLVATDGDGRMATVDVPVATGLDRDVEILLPRGEPMAGKVVVGESEPARHVEVSVYLGPDAQKTDPLTEYRAVFALSLFGQSWFWKDTTDETGAFRVEGLREGAYHLMVHDEDVGNGETEARAGDLDVVLHLDAPAEIVVHLVDVGGNPVRAHGWLLLYQVDPVSGKPLTSTSSTDANGPEIRHAGLPPGTWELYVRLDDAPSPGGMLGVEVSEGHTTEVTMVVPPPVEVRGRVTDAQHAPVSGVQVSEPAPGWSVSSGTWSFQQNRGTATDADGAFVLPHQSPKGQLFLYHPDFESKLIPYGADGDIVDVGTIVLQPGEARPWIYTVPVDDLKRRWK